MLDKEKIVKWSDMDLSHLDLSTSCSTPSPNSVNSSAPSAANSNNGIMYRQHETPLFNIDPVINSRVALWYGDIFSLTIDGTTQTTNETIDDLPLGLLERTGPDYALEIKNEIKTIRTGEAKVFRGHQNLPCRHLILTVNPKYSDKYRTAAETALFSCYNSVLQQAIEKGMNTVGIPPLHQSTKTPAYPDELGANICIRTVRRFLEKGHSLPQLIVISVADSHLFKLYESLMVSYFPREPAHEEYACFRLPVEVGDADGAPWWPDRRIRIFSNPAEHPNHSTSDDEISITLFPGELNRDFVTMKDDVDKERLLCDHGGNKRRNNMQILNEKERAIALEIETKERESRILRRARTEDFSSIQKTGCLYRNGPDRFGRPVICVIGKWFRPEKMDLDKAFLYLVKLLDEINGDYSVIYFHTKTEAENRPSFKWMRAVYDNMEYRFKKNLKSLCIIHPTIWTKMLTWWFCTFMAPAIKPKIRNMSGLQELYSVIDPGYIQIPAYITEHDVSLHGFGAVAYSINHSSNQTTPKTSNTPQQSQSASTVTSPTTATATEAQA